jgi:uncharacterized protein (DUF1697 family)
VAETHVAFIRGINVGRAKRVAMADLRALVEQLGYRDPRTLLNSGNLVFTSPRSAPSAAAVRIEQAMSKRIGVAARVTVLTAAELAAAIRGNPLVEIAHDPSRLLVAVLRRRVDRNRIAPLTRQDWAPEALAVGSRVAYLWCPEGILASRLAQAVGRSLGEDVTSRNWATMVKLHALAQESKARRSS